jgi:hypothetical protein
MDIIDYSKYFPTPELQSEFEEFRKLKTEEEKIVFQRKRQKNFSSKTLEQQKEYAEASKKGLENAVNRSKELIAEIDLREIEKIISLSYVSSAYFGKTRQWFYRKLKNSLNNGKPDCFNPDERKQLQSALLDVSEKIRKTALNMV